MSNLKWESGEPQEGVLYLAFLPIGDFLPIEEGGETMCVGSMAAAYYRKNQGWIYADEPTPLRFEPAYWARIKQFVRRVDLSVEVKG
jgi:hypothetical protein